MTEAEWIDRYIDALNHDPEATPPPKLDRDMAHFVRELVLASSAAPPAKSVQNRIWAQALAEMKPRNNPYTADGRRPQNQKGQREKESDMNRINSVVLPLPKQQARPLQGLLVAAVAAVVVIAFGVVLLSSITNYTVGVVVDRTVLFERYLDEVWNKGNLDTMSLFLTNDHIHHDTNLDADLVGIEAVTQYIETYRAQLAGLTVTVDQLTVEGDRVSGELTASVNDQTITIPVSSRFADDKLAEVWFNASDVLTALALPVAAQNPAGREIEGLELLEGYPAVQFWFEGYAWHYPVVRDRNQKCSEFIAPEAVMVKNDDTYRGQIGICGHFARIHDWIDDYTFTIENVVAEGDFVAVRYTGDYNYSHGNSMENITYLGIVMFQMDGEQLVGIWNTYEKCVAYPSLCPQ